MINTYTRVIEGRTETMVEFESGMFVNTVSAGKLGLMGPEQLKAIDRPTGRRTPS